MRQGQQNRRGRGRGRKPQNPLARNYESNGPDVKIRGTASHIAEKYMSLARDALASGDMVTAESYLQHAEHYNRIIMAAQGQNQPQGAQATDQANGGGGRHRQNQDGSDDDTDATETAEAAGGGDQPRQGGGQERGQDRGQDRGRGRGRPGGNGAQAVHDANGAEPAEATASDDSENENAPDAVS